MEVPLLSSSQMTASLMSVCLMKISVGGEGSESLTQGFLFNLVFCPELSPQEASV